MSALICFTWKDISKVHKESKNKFLIIPFGILSIHDWHQAIFQQLFSTVTYNAHRKKRYFPNHDQDNYGTVPNVFSRTKRPEPATSITVARFKLFLVPWSWTVSKRKNKLHFTPNKKRQLRNKTGAGYNLLDYDVLPQNESCILLLKKIIWTHTIQL